MCASVPLFFRARARFFFLKMFHKIRFAGRISESMLERLGKFVWGRDQLPAPGGGGPPPVPKSRSGARGHHTLCAVIAAN